MKKISTLIVSLPGTWQRVLQKNLASYPYVKVVESVNGSLSASQLTRQHQPDLILIDSSIPLDDVIALIRIVKLESPKTRSIVIADTTQQSRQIIEAGADYTLSSYHFEAQIREIFTQLKGSLLDVAESSTASSNLDSRTTV